MDKHYRKDVFLGDAHFQGNMFLGGVQVFGVQSRIYFVDKNQGDDNNNGLSWATAFASITQAITAHTAYRATRAGQSVDTWIMIAPATYAENIVALPYSCHMIGLGHIGTDKATEISPETGIAMAGTCSGLHLYNIRFEGEGSGDICDFGTLNCSIIDNCQFVPKSASMAAALSFDNCKETIIRNNRLTTGAALYVDFGIKFNGGNEKYCHNSIIEDNQIVGAVKAAGTGIYIQNTCTASGAVIRKNRIILAGAGKGIDENSDQAMVYDNYVFHVGGDAYDINAKKSAMNVDNDNGAIVIEPKINFGAQS